MTQTNCITITTSSTARVRGRLDRALDATLERVLAGDGFDAVSELIVSLDTVMRELPGLEPELIAACRAHQIHAVLQQDPYTARAYRKPRGYAGDAVMLDFIYDGRPPAGTTDVGAAVFRATTGCSAARSVRYRRGLLAEAIDQAAAEAEAATVVAVACGHLREATCSPAVTDGRLRRLIAIDQDVESLAVVARSLRGTSIEPVRESVGGLLKGRSTFDGVDLAYAAGLLDYLDDTFASLLIERLFRALRSGGRLLVANFVPGHHGRAYMACFMDWRLNLRHEQALAALAVRLDGRAIGDLRTFTDRESNVAYLEVTRA